MYISGKSKRTIESDHILELARLGFFVIFVFITILIKLDCKGVFKN